MRRVGSDRRGDYGDSLQYPPIAASARPARVAPGVPHHVTRHGNPRGRVGLIDDAGATNETTRGVTPARLNAKIENGG
jgi:hypothetical protein